MSEICSVRDHAYALFRSNVSGVVTNYLQSVLTPDQFAILLSIVNGHSVGGGIFLATNLTDNQIMRLRNRLPQNILCLLVMVITLDIVFMMGARGTNRCTMVELLVQWLHSPSIGKLAQLNAGGCGGRVYEEIFTLFNLRNALPIRSVSLTVSPLTGPMHK